MAATIIIPARLASTRFPEKVLASETGKPLVQHVVECAARARCAGTVVVAADHERIAAALKPFGTRVILTRPDHPNGTSRLAEAAALLGLAPSDIIVNAQGDEPDMPGAVIDAAADALCFRTDVSVGTVGTPITSAADAANPNVVKVARAANGLGLYFSRSCIPFDRDGRAEPGAQPLRHIGVYAYRREFLERYAALPSTPLERAEQLEQLRVLEHGYRIAVGVVSPDQAGSGGVDTPEQYQAFVARFRAARG